MQTEASVYQKHMNLKLAAAELGIAWQTLYVRLKRIGVPVTGDKLRYGTDRDRLGALAEAEFQGLVPTARDANKDKWQAKVDFNVGGWLVDVKCSVPRRLNKRFAAESWAFSFKKQSLVCDFVCCFCMSHDREIEAVLLVPSEFFAGLQTVTVSCKGSSKWMDYQVPPESLAEFFKELGAKPSQAGD